MTIRAAHVGTAIAGVVVRFRKNKLTGVEPHQ
jgi:hypothetical protein